MRPEKDIIRIERYLESYLAVLLDSREKEQINKYFFQSAGGMLTALNKVLANVA